MLVYACLKQQKETLSGDSDMSGDKGGDNALLFYFLYYFVK